MRRSGQRPVKEGGHPATDEVQNRPITVATRDASSSSPPSDPDVGHQTAGEGRHAQHDQKGQVPAVVEPEITVAHNVEADETEPGDGRDAERHPPLRSPRGERDDPRHQQQGHRRMAVAAGDRGEERRNGPERQPDEDRRGSLPGRSQRRYPLV